MKDACGQTCSHVLAIPRCKGDEGFCLTVELLIHRRVKRDECTDFVSLLATQVTPFLLRVVLDVVYLASPIFGDSVHFEKIDCGDCSRVAEA